jgi:hypothetical protein
MVRLKRDYVLVALLLFVVLSSWGIMGDVGSKTT